MLKNEIASNLEVLLLLIFMVAGIYFMKQLLLFIFTRLLLSIPSKTLLSLAFCLAAAFLSAFLDAPDGRCGGSASPSAFTGFTTGGLVVLAITCRTTVTMRRTTAMCWNSSSAFLRSLMMHAGVGTALGGVMTMVEGSR